MRSTCRAAANDREAEVQASRIEHLRAVACSGCSRRRDELSQQRGREPGDADADEINQLAEQVTSLESEARLLDMRIDECLKELGSAREDVIVRDRVLEEARSEVQTLRHELAALQALQDAALGQEQSEASAWIAAHDLSGSARLGESLAVVPGWERAVETALGHFLSALEVDDLDALATSLAQMPDGDLALIETGATRGVQDSNAELQLPALASLIRSDALSAGSLVHGIYAAESSAVALRKRHLLRSGESIITREGFWVGTDWMRVLHDQDAQLGIIERGQEIETLALRVEQSEETWVSYSSMC